MIKMTEKEDMLMIEFTSFLLRHFDCLEVTTVNKSENGEHGLVLRLGLKGNVFASHEVHLEGIQLGSQK